MRLGEIIADYCRDHGLSYRQFALQCGVTNGYISMVVNGANPKTGKPLKPTIESYSKLAAGMGMSTNELFEMMDDAPVSLAPPASRTIPADLKPVKETIGERIKQRRKQIGMSAEQLAEIIGKSAATVYRYENGSIESVDSQALQPIADALGVTPGYLMGWGESVDEADDDLWTLREEERRDPDRKALYMLAKYGTAKDIRQANAIIDALKATNPDFYDGDDPA